MQLKLSVFLFLIFSLTNFISVSQTQMNRIKNDSTSLRTGNKNTLFVELLGNAAAISINYDRIVLRKKNISLTVCIGAGMIPSNLINQALHNSFKSNYVVYGIPISTNLFWGRRKSHFEIGAGLTYHQGMYGLGPNKYSKTLFAVARLGYRYQKENGGFFWKIGLTPLFAIADFGEIESSAAVPLSGISLGYTLKR